MPIRRCQTATHFVRMHDGKFCPVPPGTPGATAMTIMEVPPRMLAVPRVTMEDFYVVMKKAKSSVGSEELTKYDEWTREFGEEGA